MKKVIQKESVNTLHTILMKKQFDDKKKSYLNEIVNNK